VWHHGSIPDFIACFDVSNVDAIPRTWPEDRFDLVWVLSPKDGSYIWGAVTQGLLKGDA
jgi:hypothetical protein